MSFPIDLQPNGLFICHHEAGRPIFDGAFRTGIPEELRMRVLNVISEAPSMLALLKMILADVEGLVEAVIKEHGEEGAHAKASQLFALRDVIRHQIAAAEGVEIKPLAAQSVSG